MLSIQFLLSFAWRLTIGSFCDGHPYRRKCKTSTFTPAKPGDYLLNLVEREQSLGKADQRMCLLITILNNSNLLIAQEKQFRVPRFLANSVDGLRVD